MAAIKKTAKGYAVIHSVNKRVLSRHKTKKAAQERVRSMRLRSR